MVADALSRDCKTERIAFACPSTLLDVIDQAADASFASRSDFIRGAVVERLRREGVISAPQGSAA